MHACMYMYACTYTCVHTCISSTYIDTCMHVSDMVDEFYLVDRSGDSVKQSRLYGFF